MDERIYSGSGMNGLITVGWNRTGMDAGELDFGIASARVQDLSSEERLRLLNLLMRVQEECCKLWKIDL